MGASIRTLVRIRENGREISYLNVRVKEPLEEAAIRMAFYWPHRPTTWTILPSHLLGLKKSQVITSPTFNATLSLSSCCESHLRWHGRMGDTAPRRHVDSIHKSPVAEIDKVPSGNYSPTSLSTYLCVFKN